MTSVERIKYVIKVVVSHVLYGMGLLQLWQHIVLRRKAVILMYHRVLTDVERVQTCSHPGIVVDRQTFARQMATLKRRFNVLSVEEFADRMERQIAFDDSSCLITFDDGWKDNFTHALPILQQYELPAVIFLPVNFIGGKRMFWQEQLTYLVLQAVIQARKDPKRHQVLRELLAAVHLESVLDLPDHGLRPAVMEAVRRQKGLAAAVISKTLANLAKELGVQTEDFEETDGFLDWDQVQLMSGKRIAFGGHGAEHRLLTEVSTDEAREEIYTAKTVMKPRLKDHVATFSYPNGNWSPDVANLVKESGYRLGFTTQPGFVKCDDDRFTIRRVNIHESMTNSTPMFLARVMGLF